MWIRGKRGTGRWADWDWLPDMDPDRLCRIRLAVRKAFATFVQRLLAQGEKLIRPHMPHAGYTDLLIPLGFTPNDFVQQVVEQLPYGVRVDFFNGHYFFQSVQIAQGSWDSGAKEPFERLPNTFRMPAGGWERADDRAIERGYRCRTENPQGFVVDDGGRAAAGYLGSTRDCVTRSIAIATGKPYDEVYDALNAMARLERPREGRKRSASRTGVHRATYERYLQQLGWTWVPTMRIGAGCTVHLRAEELPQGRIIVRLSKHLTAVLDGVIHDTFDPSREGSRCVYGYFIKSI